MAVVLSRPYWPWSISNADPGELTEPRLTLTPDVPATLFVDATDAWRLARVDVGGEVDAPAGGVAVADMDNDGDLDLVVANGRAAIIPWENGSYGEPTDFGIDGAVAVTATDVDGDGWVDVLVARRAPEDVVVWEEMPAGPHYPAATARAAGSPPISVAMHDSTSSGWGSP